MSERQPLAFLSYVRSDDEHDGGRITSLRERLEGEVKMHTGKPFPIFQDRNDLSWGQHWQIRIKQSISEVTFLIPIITPSFFQSPACRDEFNTFAVKEQTLGVARLILPIYYLTADQMSEEYPRGKDLIADVLRQRQWTDWRPFRFKSYQDERVAEALAALAVAIKASSRELGAIFDLADEKAVAAGGPQPRTSVPPPQLSRQARKVAADPTSTDALPKSCASLRLTRELIEPYEIRPARKRDGRVHEVQGGDRSAYRVYTKRYDEVVDAAMLCPPEDLFRYFARLGDITAALRERHEIEMRAFEQAVSAVVSAAGSTGVSVLVDNSGSLREEIPYVAAWSLIIAETLERSGVKAEVAGYTTRAWKGGRTRELWVKDKRPKNPGRLNDLRYIIYKSMNDSMIGSAPKFGAMLHEGVLKENIDGEALLWAYDKLVEASFATRVVMVLTDGSPVDDSTLSANPANLLSEHLSKVASWIESRGDTSLCAVGIGIDPSGYYKSALSVAATREDLGINALRLLRAVLLPRSRMRGAKRLGEA